MFLRQRDLTAAKFKQEEKLYVRFVRESEMDKNLAEIQLLTNLHTNNSMPGSCLHTLVRTYILMCVYTLYTYMHACMHACMYTRMYVYMFVYVYACMHTYILCIHTCIHTYVYAYMHTYIHTDIYIVFPVVCMHACMILVYAIM
jgi:hypothetical protein